MFVNKHHLEYLLKAEDYYAPEVHREELERVLRPAWQFVGSKSEMPRSGDFITLDLFGHPIQIRNFGGKHYAYENVCCHRHCLLTHEPKGHSETIRCQYHGWEYQKDGRTGRIPDAKCFRPWDRENSRLNTYRLESCGDLLFVALTDEAPPLREFLAPFYDELAPLYSAPQWKMGYAWEYECPCNWKVPAENTLESYHIPELHQKTFGQLYPSEPNSEHLLDERYTVLDYDSSEDPRVLRYQAPLVRWMGAEPTNKYVHRHFHPNLVVVTTDTFNYALTYIPTSPTTMKIRVRMYGFQGTRRGPLAKLLAWICWSFGRNMMKRIQMEDWNVFADQQRGLEVSGHKGVIGTREERIYVFQRWWMDRMGRTVSRAGEQITGPIATIGPRHHEPTAAK